MAKLSANGEVIIEMVTRTLRTDGADADPMTCETRTTRRAMTSGYVLIRHDVKADYGFGGPVRWHNGTWKRDGKIKAELLANHDALRAAFHAWADKYRAKGMAVEITQ